MAIKKITEELDFLQKRVAAVREIHGLYPDTVIKYNWQRGEAPTNECYISPSINKNVDIVRFNLEKNWYNAYTSKLVGCIEICSVPDKFALFAYFPGELLSTMIIQNYHDSMTKHHIPESIIRDCDLRIISFIKENNIDLSKTNLRDMKPDTTIGKLLSLL